MLGDDSLIFPVICRCIEDALDLQMQAPYSNKNGTGFWVAWVSSNQKRNVSRLQAPSILLSRLLRLLGDWVFVCDGLSVANETYEDASHAFSLLYGRGVICLKPYN